MARTRYRWPGLFLCLATPLLGREQEAAAVEELVVGEGVRLVTLTGPGGVGKTRLIVEAARRLGPGFADGARFVELASVSAADLVAAAIAAALGLNTRRADDHRPGAHLGPGGCCWRSTTSST